jgi:hypothetical protein
MKENCDGEKKLKGDFSFKKALIDACCHHTIMPAYIPTYTFFDQIIKKLLTLCFLCFN